MLKEQNRGYGDRLKEEPWREGKVFDVEALAMINPIDHMLKGPRVR